MQPSDELLYDHAVLRGKLALLEDYLPSAHDVPATLALLTDSLACCLRAHDAREEHLLEGLSVRPRSPADAVIRRLHDEHDNQRIRLAILHELLTRPGGPPGDQAAAQAEYLIRDLRKHMAEVEAIFPTLNDAARTHTDAARAPRAEEADDVVCLGMA